MFTQAQVDELQVLASALRAEIRGTMDIVESTNNHLDKINNEIKRYYEIVNEKSLTIKK